MDINPNQFLGPISFGNAILWILGFAGLIGIVDYIGVLPPRAAKWLARNRLETTLKSLRQLGVRVCWDEEKNTVSVIERALDAVHIKEAAYKIRLRELLKDDTFIANVNVGSKRMFSSNNFVDVMGGSTSGTKASEYAKILNTHASVEAIGDFDVVATPKTGSPILGYEFSQLVGKPLVLGVLVKVDDTTGKMGKHAYLDCPKTLALRGKKVLIVDGTTGGRKILDLVDELRNQEATVSDALVLFEPIGKGARDALGKQNIKLHSIVEGPGGRF
jgi:orotate phosphoribosyltransferase